MSHIHWVTRQNKLEIPRDKDEVRTRNPRIRWTSAGSRNDGSPTDTQTDTESRNPHHETVSPLFLEFFFLTFFFR
jgi:hypothetical protein